MKIHHWWMGALVGASLAVGGCASMEGLETSKGSMGDASDRRFLAQDVVDNWSNVSAMAARRLIEEYGVPDEVHANRLVWNQNGPWKRTVVREVKPPYTEPGDLGVVEQTINYSMTPGQADAVSAFDPQVTFNARSSELSALSDREELNYLRLNLADDIVRRGVSVNQAHETFANIVSLEQSGKSSPYMAGLGFQLEQ